MCVRVYGGWWLTLAVIFSLPLLFILSPSLGPRAGWSGLSAASLLSPWFRLCPQSASVAGSHGISTFKLLAEV